MARRVTSGIKGRKRTTVYLTKDIENALDEAYIEAQQRTKRRVDRTLFFDALMQAGLNHTDDIINMLRQLKDSPND